MREPAAVERVSASREERRCSRFDGVNQRERRQPQHDGAQKQRPVRLAHQKTQRAGDPLLAIARTQKGHARRDHAHRDIDQSGRDQTEADEGVSHPAMIPCARGLERPPAASAHLGVDSRDPFKGRKEPPKMKTMSLLLSVALAAALAAASASADEKKPTAPSDPEKKSESKMTKTPSGLQYEDIQVGTGAAPKTGQTCVMHYTGWLWENGAKGKKFDSSVDRGTPFEFPLGQGRVIKGWDEGVATMKVGGKRLLLIPSQLAYGPSGRPPIIPPSSTLLFEVELLDVK
jgi:peptidylprolyl isomerase